jgi:hypothetical protein
MDTDEKKSLALVTLRAMLQANQKLVEANNKVKIDKLSKEDSKKHRAVLDSMARTTKATGETIAAVADTDELYEQMTASNERLREEIEHQIAIVETILSRQRT